ncbi:AlkA N-terminal domain-containing protein, partial [Paraburkholderia sp.]|uniref:AlkA N-terminal domain-containing protein n=1 Tax=Paraburkholderia sp. TaxID=1926495 RepID=UPI003D6DFDA7
IRRFNETFQILYNRPPSALRRGNAEEVSARGGVGLSLRLPYRPPYDWDAMAGFLSHRAIPGVEIVAPGHYARSIAIGPDQGVVVVRPLAGDRLSKDSLLGQRMRFSG